MNTNDVSMISLSIVFIPDRYDDVMLQLDALGETGLSISVADVGRARYRVSCSVEDERKVREFFDRLPGVAVVRTSDLG
jgi:hypothetical protein